MTSTGTRRRVIDGSPAVIAEAYPMPDGGWAVFVPHIGGLCAQSPTLSQVQQAVVDAASALGYAIGAENVGVRAVTR